LERIIALEHPGYVMNPKARSFVMFMRKYPAALQEVPE
jgi:hypothetical protein